MRKIKGIHLIILLIAVFFVFTGCKKDNSEEAWNKLDEFYKYKVEDYFSIENNKKAKFWIAKTNFINNGPNIDTIRKFYTKIEKNDGYYIDLEGNKWLKISVDSSSDNNNYTTVNLSLYKKYEASILQKRNNLITTILKQPLKKGVYWDANEWNNLGADYMKVINPDTIIELNYETTGGKKTKIYNNCMVIRQFSLEDSYLSKIEVIEIYAPGIGKIKRSESYIYYLDSDQKKITDQSYLYEEIRMEQE